VRQVRPLTPPLIAKRPVDGRGLVLPSGQIVFPTPTDWLVCRDDLLTDVCTEEQLLKSYQILEEGTFLSRARCVQIEESTGVGSTRTPAELVKAISRLARITIGDIRIDFTPGQLEEIAHRAAKRGYTVEQEIGRIVDRIKDEIFYKS